MALSMSSAWTQFFPPRPNFSIDDIPDLSDKIFIVTGANTGLGKELTRSLYSKNAKVYLTTRTQSKAQAAIEDIQKTTPRSSGALFSIQLDLEDLSSIKTSADRFLNTESNLHGVFHNAGYMGPEGDMETTKQGYEKHIGVNCLGTFMFNKLLLPLLVSTAQHPSTPANTVRVIFMSSFAAEMFSEKDVGIQMDNLDYHVKKPAKYRYGVSKVGDWAYAVELSKRYKHDGVIGVPLNPGNIQSDLFRQQSFLFKLFTRPFNYPIMNGVKAQLWAAFSPEINVESAGRYVGPFGRFVPFRRDLGAATKTQDEGGNGTTALFWDWSEEQVAKYT
ncbi:putative estradiol 17 beta-dehydrogenase [Nemania diffusa]|nr:putative estradiol 17 beta-dehydrogenase [Nemania diffusa]